MIIHKDSKSVETFTDHPNDNFGNYENVFIVVDDSELGKKILSNHPYFEFVLDGGGILIDVTPTERPPEPVPEPTELELLQEDNASLWYESMIQSTRVEANETEVASLWYELMMGGI